MIGGTSAGPNGKSVFVDVCKFALPVNWPTRALSCMYVLAATTPLLAQTPAALVESVNSTTAGVEFMDYVSAGRVIRLAPSDTIVLSYLRSCWREVIVGGIITVGTEHSDVQFADIEREKVECDGGKLSLSEQEAAQSAGMVFRDSRSGKQSLAPKPQITIYGLSPIVEVRRQGILVIERIDQPGERYEEAVPNAASARGFYDLAQSGKSLVAGGTYRTKLGTRQLVFKIHPEAKPGASPIIGRLLRLEPN